MKESFKLQKKSKTKKRTITEQEEKSNSVDKKQK